MLDKGTERTVKSMSGFVSVAPGVFYLSPQNAEFGGGVTLVTGANKFLIDCGAFDASVSKFIVPALKAIKLDIKDIDYALFTHCHPENMGGVHKLKQLAPNIKILSCGYQTERLKNPSYYFMSMWSDFLDDSPPFREIKGVLPDGIVNAENIIFSELRPIFAQGHDSDCVCWYHTATETLICGDAVQGGGTPETGIPFITSLQYYRNTLSDLIETAPQNMICGRPFIGIENGVVIGREECQRVLEYSYDKLSEYGIFVDRFAKLKRSKRENLNVEELTKAYFEENKEPQRYGYAMHTFREYIRNKR